MIQLKSVSEIYTLRFFHREKPEEEKVHALKDITLTIAPGECCNLIGENGSGKTTLLKVIAGLIDPTHGEVKINGRAGVLMEMGAGFHPDLTGRENVLAAAPLYGRTAEEIKTIMPEIEAFADLGKFFDAPIRTYSHGMYLRLAFSYAVHLDPGILCIDDIIAVGDELARQKCFEKIDEFKKAGKTILLVTHDLALAKKFAPRTLWMKNGELMRDGETDSVIQEYQQFCRNNNTLFVMEGWQHLFLEEKEDKHLLQFKENPLLCFENMKLSLQTENAVFESRPVEFQEWSRKFCRFVFPFESPHFQAEGILSLSGSSEFILEWFFENPIAILKEAITARLYLSVEENFSALTVQPGLFSNLEKHTRFRLHDEKRQTGLSGTLVPKMEIIQEQNSLVLESIFMPECYPAYRKRIGCLTAGLSDEKNPGEGNAPFVSIENPFLKLTSVGTGFSLKHDDKDLLAYEGVEILFEFLGKTWSSTQAEKMEARKETDSLIVVFSHRMWPVQFELKAMLNDKEIRWVLKLIPKSAEDPIRNLRFQILWDPGHIVSSREKGDQQDSPLMIKNLLNETIEIKACASNPVWLLTHSYQEKENSANVVYLLDPHPDYEKEYILSAEWKQDVPFKSVKKSPSGFVVFGNGGVSFHSNTLTHLQGWSHYASVFSSPLWHDSYQALWTKSGNEWRGILPWLSEAAFLFQYVEKHGQIADVCWKLEIIAPVRIEKVQLCFHLDESFYQVLDSKGNELKINRSRAGNNRHEVHEATLSNDHYVFKRPEGQLTLDGRKLLFPFVQSVESSSQRALISNFTWLPDPVLFEPGIHELGSIRIFFIPFS